MKNDSFRGRFLCVGDIHLGRAPSRVPDDLAGVDSSEVGPAAAWRNAVDAAIDNDVDSVLMAGDVVERIEDRFAAFGALRGGVERLIEHGINVVAVTGNHDVEALPRLAKLLPDLRLLGAGGSWESTQLARDGKHYADVWGWSFPEREVRESPFGSFPKSVPQKGLRFGLLHADLDAHGSHFAPVARRELEATGFNGWFLGHIHAPSFGRDRKPLGYLGSLVGLDPGEHGKRGPWLVEVTGDGKPRWKQLALAPLRFERLEIDVSDLESNLDEALDLEGLSDALHARIDDLALGGVAEKLRDELGFTKVLGIRVTLTGNVANRARLGHALERLREAKLTRVVDTTAVFIEKLIDNTRPVVDLEMLARDSSYPGLLARRIRALEEMNEVGVELVERAGPELVKRLSQTRGAEPQALDDDSKRDLLLRAAHKSLDALLAQREAETAGAH